MSQKDCNSGAAGCDVTIDDPEAAIILRGSLADLQRAAERLDSNGIECVIVRPDQDPSGCCSPANMCLAVARDDVPAAFALFDQDWRRGLTADQIEALEASAHIVLDPDAAETTCPACMTTFATGPAECPDCGLRLG